MYISHSIMACRFNPLPLSAGRPFGVKRLKLQCNAKHGNARGQMEWNVGNMQGRESGPVVTDVVLELNERGQELQGVFQCSSDIFTRASAQRLAHSFQVVSTDMLRFVSWESHLLDTSPWPGDSLHPSCQHLATAHMSMWRTCNHESSGGLEPACIF